MPVSGLVVSLSSQPSLREAAVAALRGESCIELGPMEAGKMAIVVDTSSSEEDKRLWDWLNSLPGVVFVDVALVGFE